MLIISVSGCPSVHFLSGKVSKNSWVDSSVVVLNPLWTVQSTIAMADTKFWPFKFLISGRLIVAVWEWFCDVVDDGRCLIKSWMHWALRRCRRRQFTRASHTRWTARVLIFCCLLHTNGTSRDLHCLLIQSLLSYITASCLLVCLCCVGVVFMTCIISRLYLLKFTLILLYQLCIILNQLLSDRVYAREPFVSEFWNRIYVESVNFLCYQSSG